jgi:lipid-A-disaccharide synthase
LGTPALVSYKVSPVTYKLICWILQRRLGRIPYMSMVNELLGYMAMPEFKQHDATPAALVNAAKKLLGDPEERSALLEAYRKARHALGDPGCFERAADEVLPFLSDTAS